MIERTEVDGKPWLTITCDADGCDTVAPPADQILAGHGLNNMGWRCSGGTHFCPAHAAIPEDA